MKSDIKMGKIYLYKTANRSVAYDEEHWYVDDNPQQQNDGDGISQFKDIVMSTSEYNKIFGFRKDTIPNAKDLREGIHNFIQVRISLRWYRCSGELVPRGAEAWYRSYRSDGTGTKRPLHTLSEGAMQTVLQGTLN